MARGQAGDASATTSRVSEGGMAPEASPRPGTPMTGHGGVLPQASPSQVTPRTVAVVVLTALAIAGGLLLLWLLRGIVQWTVIALFLAVALSPAVGWLERHRVPRGLAILLVYVLLMLVVALLAALVLPPLVEQVQGLVAFVVEQARAPGGLSGAAEDLANRYGIGGYVAALREQASGLPGQLGAAVGPLVAVSVGIFGSVTALISILLLTFFLLLDSDRFIAAALHLFNPAQRPRLRRLLSQAANAIHGYVNGNLAISLIAGVAAFIALAILGMPYALALALIVALLDLLPLVGGTLGAAVVVLIALFVDPVKAGILAVYFLIYQQVENNVVQPLVYGRSVKLHPLAIFLAVLAGAQLLGILGALLAIPVAEIVRILGAEWLASRARETGGTPHGADDEARIEEVTADAAGPAA